MFLIADRWEEFTETQKAEISARILRGFDNPGHVSDEEFTPFMVKEILRRGRWLQNQGCVWPNEQAQQLDEFAESLSDWSTIGQKTRRLNTV